MVDSGVALAATVVVVVATAAVGIVAGRRGIATVEDFISARNTVERGSLTATIVASSMGAWILFSPAEAGAAFGGISAVVGYAVGSAVPLAVYAFLGPRIRRLIPAGHSLTEYAYVRYGPTMYAFVLVISVAYMFAFLAAEMTGIARGLQVVAGVPLWQTALTIGLAVACYTAYGGLKASVLTDAVQTLVILPLLAVGFGAALLSLGGARAIHAEVVATDPTLLDPGFAGGVEFGIYVVVAILAAEMLNQAWWQRIYAAADSGTLRRSFLVAAVAVVPMVFLAGLFGLVARGRGVGTDQASEAFFVVVGDAFADPIVLAVVVLAVLLVTSSADTLFNAIASVVTADLPRLVAIEGRALTLAARVLTVVVALASTFVAAQGYSVLAVFFVADLLATATFVPLLAGLYSRRLTGGGALVAGVGGLLVGGALFPLTPPTLQVLPLPATFFNAFIGAATVSLALTLLAALVSGARFDLGRLDREIARLDDPTANADGGRLRSDGGSTATAPADGDEEGERC
ncbi:sodium:solute symporter family transporter [Halomarina ordinaria]|uniref:Sodium:proline symporter n=1 Tax=Halomarina ordinaria TaxID=3033939 RepID=A0ABD5U808_9EURY|nr:sodium:proline symporter [Halomarina sp. PSRA2]